MISRVIFSPDALRRALLVMLLALAFPVSAQDWVYTVVDGDTLWDLSEKYLHRVGYWRQLQRINNVQDPKRLQPGQRVRVPLKWIRSSPAGAEVAAVEGMATLFRADGVRVSPLAPKQDIRLGDRLETASDASVAVRLADESLVTVHGNSTVSFDHLSSYGDTGMVDTRLRLEDGRTEARVRPAVGPGSRFEIHTPSAISAVRGTRYRTAVAGDDDGAGSAIEVLEGTVRVDGRGGGRLVRSGFGTQVATGAAPQKPRPLLDPPALDAIPEPVRQLNWPVAWQPLAGADRYRMEVASTPDFAVLLWERTSESNRMPFPDLPDGEYHLRVRGIDGTGLEGRDARRRLLLDARPQPPLPLLPRQDEVSRGGFPELRWTASAEAAAYRLEVAADDRFSDPLIDRSGIVETRFTLPGAPAPGRYFWRLTSIAADGEQGPPGAARSWRVKPIPQRPEPTVEAGAERVVVSWRAGAPGQTYRLQMALDKDFQQLVLDEALTEPQREIEQVKGQLHYVRVRLVEPDGYLGPWGATQKLDPAPDSSWILVLLPWLLGLLLL